MIKLTVVAALSTVASVALASLAPVAPTTVSRDRSITLIEASVDKGTLRNSGASEVYASPVVVSVPSRTAARPVVATIAHANRTFVSCSTRALMQGSGFVQSCETVVVR